MKGEKKKKRQVSTVILSAEILQGSHVSEGVQQGWDLQWVRVRVRLLRMQMSLSPTLLLQGTLSLLSFKNTMQPLFINLLFLLVAQLRT